MRTFILLAIAVVFGLAFVPAVALAQNMSLEEAVTQARTVNPQVRGARFPWESAKHQIIQNYTPADPQFSFSNQDSWRGFLSGSGLHSMTVTQSLQFPGKGVLQGRTAARTAEIARLTYMAAVRDVTAQAKAAYYQIQLDLALNDLINENVTNLERVLKVTQIAYTANLATQGDYINAKFALRLTANWRDNRWLLSPMIKRPSTSCLIGGRTSLYRSSEISILRALKRRWIK